MTKTIDELRAQLSVIEPTEASYAGIGPDDVDALTGMLDDPEPWLAARAASALLRVDSPRAAQLLTEQVRSGRVEVRQTIAAGVHRLPTKLATPIIELLEKDEAPSVRKFTVAARQRLANRPG